MRLVLAMVLGLIGSVANAQEVVCSSPVISVLPVGNPEVGLTCQDTSGHTVQSETPLPVAVVFRLTDVISWANRAHEVTLRVYDAAGNVFAYWLFSAQNNTLSDCVSEHFVTPIVVPRGGWFVVRVETDGNPASANVRIHGTVKTN